MAQSRIRSVGDGNQELAWQASRPCIVYAGGEGISALSFVREEIYQIFTPGGDIDRNNEHASGCMC